MKKGKIEKVSRVGIRKKQGYLYYVDEDGDAAVKKKGGDIGKKLAMVRISKERGYFYFIDGKGDISRKISKKKKKTKTEKSDSKQGTMIRGERFYNKRICDVCGRSVNTDDILGMCTKCGKIVCKSWFLGCGRKQLFGKVFL
jgi:hypothetical protein